MQQDEARVTIELHRESVLSHIWPHVHTWDQQEEASGQGHLKTDGAELDCAWRLGSFHTWRTDELTLKR